jgi:hypothetical protein
MQIPYDWPVADSLGNKMGIWSKALPPSKRSNPVCASYYGWEERSNYNRPSTAGGEGKCKPGESGSLWGSPWAENEYEMYMSDIMKRMLAQMSGGYWTNISLATESALAGNRWQVGAVNSNWHYGIDPDVYFHAKFLGFRAASKRRIDIP